MAKFFESMNRNMAKLWNRHSTQHNVVEKTEPPFDETNSTACGQPAHLIRKHILFYGRVQGVGFRYYSVYKARLLQLTGWVRNLYNGSVEMEVQGDEALIEELIVFLKNQRSVLIEKIEMETIPVIKEQKFCERG